jgi:TolA-binding protein
MDEYSAYLAEFPGGAHTADARYRLGEAAFAAEDYAKALEAYAGVLQGDAAGAVRDRAMARHAEALYMLGRYPEADSAFQALLRSGLEGEARVRALYFQGKSRYHIRQYEGALESLYEAANQHPGDPLAPYARYQLAHVYLEMGDLENAAVAFSETAKSAGEAALQMECRFRAAEAYDRLGWHDAAVSAYQALRAEHPGSEYAQRAGYAYAWALFRAGDTARAAEEAVSAAKYATPEQAAGLAYLRASISQTLKQYDEALAGYEALRQTHPGSPYAARALYQSAYVNHLMGNAARAKEQAMAFLDLHRGDPLTGDAAFLLGILLVAEGNYEDAHQEFRLVAEKYPEAEFAGDALYKSAECLAQLGMTDEAAARFAEYAAKYPGSALAGDATLRAADAEFFADDFKAAITGYEAILKGDLTPEVEQEALYRLAVAHHNMQDYAKSVERFRQFTEKFPKAPEAPEAYRHLGDHALREQNDLTAAIAAYNNALEAGADERLAGHVRRGLAIARHENGDFDEAAALFLGLMREYPDAPLNETAFAWTGEHFFDAEQWAEASEAYRALLARVPAYPNPERIHFRIAECAERQGRQEEALSLYAAVAEKAPASNAAMQARLHMAKLHDAAGNKEEALRLYEAASTLNNGDVAARACFRLAELQAEAGEEEKAARSYLRVAFLFLHAELSPEAMLRAAKLYAGMGEQDRARETLRQLEKEYPEAPQAAEAREALEGLEQP